MTFPGAEHPALKAFQLHYCPDKNAKSMVKHFIFLHKFSVLSRVHATTLHPFSPFSSGFFCLDAIFLCIVSFARD